MSRTIGRIMGTLHQLLSSRTWRLRGAAAAVLVVLAGGWTLGVAGLGGETATDRAVATPSESASATPSDIPTPEEIDPSEPTGTSTTAAEATPSATEPADGGVEQVAETPDGEPERSQEPPRTRNPDPTPTRGTPTPRPSESPTPTETADCADLAEAVNCLLAPITSKP